MTTVPSLRGLCKKWYLHSSMSFAKQDILQMELKVFNFHYQSSAMALVNVTQCTRVALNPHFCNWLGFLDSQQQMIDPGIRDY